MVSTTFGGATIGDHLVLDRTPATDSLSGLSVLVAEDNVILSMHLCMVLEDAGARVVGPFPFVQEALDAIEEEAPDLALLDHALSEGDCGPVASRLHALGVPFAFFTGHPPDELAPISRDAPVMRKPSTNGAIVDTLGGLIA